MPFYFPIYFPSTTQPAPVSGLVWTKGAKTKLTERGIRWANAPDGRADLVTINGPSVWHVSNIQTVIQQPALVERSGMYSGAIKFRYRSYRNFPVPISINVI